MIQYPPSQNWTSFSRWAMFLRKFNMWVFAMLAALSNDIILAWQFAWILRFPSFEFNGMQDRALQKYSSVFFFTYTPLLYYFAKRVRHGMTFAVCLRLSLQWYHPFFFSFIFLPSGVKLLPTTNVLLGNRAWATKRPKLDMITHGVLIKDYKNHIRDALKTTDPSNEKKKCTTVCMTH